MSTAPADAALPRPDDPVRGILLMLAAMFVFSCVDGLTKALTADYHPIMVAWGRFVFQTLLLVPVVAYAGPYRVLRTGAPGLQVLRALLLFGSTVFFVNALAHLPLAEASAIGFVSPLITTALSIPLLGEKVGIRRWAAAALGFAGVLIVIRPGTATFDPASLLPVASAFSWSLGLIVTRRMIVHADMPLTTLLYASIVGLAASSVPVAWFWSTPGIGAWALMLLIGALSMASHYILIVAFRYGSASILAPISYSQMVWATIIGYAAFNMLPDRWTWVGAGVIIASGIYTWHRERVRRGLIKT